MLLFLDHGMAAEVTTVFLNETEIALSCDNDHRPLLVIDNVHCLEDLTGDTERVGSGEDTENLQETSPMTSMPHVVYVTLTRHCFRQSRCSVLLRDVSEVYEECGSQPLTVGYHCVSCKFSISTLLLLTC